MSTPPPSPGLATDGNRPHGYKHSDRQNAKHTNRPEGSRHGSDWLSKLHRRHDAKHHAPSHQDEEQAPLLAQADDHEEDYAQGHEEAGISPGTHFQLRLLKPAQDCLLAIKTALLKCASHAGNGAMKTGRGAKKASKAVGKAMSKGARNSSQAIKKNPKRTLSAFIIFLLLANIATAIIFGLHLLTDAMFKISSNPSSIRAGDNMLRNLRPKADAKGADNLSATTETENVDPCTAFDEFVCGGFDKRHDFRSEQSHVDTSAIVLAKAARLLRDTVEASASEVSSSDNEIFKKLKDHYTACMDEAQVAKQGLKTLKATTEKVKDLMRKHDPVLPGDLRLSLQVSTAAHAFDIEALTDTMAFLAELGVPALINFHVAPDPHSPSQHKIFASPVQAIGLPAPQWYKDMKVVSNYREVAKATLKHFLDVEVNTTNALHLYPRQKPRLTGILELAQGIVDLEVKLASIMPAMESELDVTNAYHKVNASEFATMLPQISLHRLVKALAPPDYIVKSVVVPSPEYLLKLHALLKGTTKEVLSGFMVWKIVQQHADRIEDPALKSLKDFYAKLKGSRVDQPPERWRQCVNAMNTDLSWLTSWFFLKGSKADLEKTKATEIANKVSSSFTKLIKKSTWMAKEDSERSANKVQALQQEISSPKNMDASSLGKYYHTLTIKSDTYFENKLAAAGFVTHESWSKLVTAVHPKDWHVTPLSTRPSYDPISNRLILPETLLHSPISYTKSIPDNVLYGSFGAMSGHGMSKALGPVGSYHSKNGSFADQWSEQTREKYQKKAQCLVDQYSKYTISGPDGKVHHVNGKLTLDVNMADVAGVNAAFEAWKEHEKQSPGLLVPGLEKYSRDQIFWIAFGNTLCSMTTKNQAIQDVRSSPYTPERIRILGTVANSKGFLEAFNCPIKKPKCDLW